MSVIAFGTPFLLINVVAPLAFSAITNYATNQMSEEIERTKSYHLGYEQIEKLEKETFKTTFVDEKTLIQTLEQYGASDISTKDKNVSCICENFILNFQKNNPNDKTEPYFLNIKYKRGENINSLIQDLSDEYLLNTQEASYNKIKERLKEKNLEIYKEEVLEDDTIVLTINLE